NLTRADKNATTIKSLKATIGVVLLAGTAPEITITDPVKVKTKTFSGRTMELEYGALTEDANNKGHYVLEVTAKKLGVVDPNRGLAAWGAHTPREKGGGEREEGGGAPRVGPQQRQHKGEGGAEHVRLRPGGRGGHPPAAQARPAGEAGGQRVADGHARG